MAKYPIFIELADRRAVVIGGGAVALRKAQILLDAGAKLVVVAKKIDDTLVAACKNCNAELIESEYSKVHLSSSAVIVIAATNNYQLNKQVYKDCQELNILCNVVDQPKLCDFFVPAVVKRGNLQIAISTDGNCPAYAGYLRKKLEQIFTEKHGEFLVELEEFRKKIIKHITDSDGRKALLDKLVDDESFDYFVKNDPSLWRERAERIINEYQL